MTYSVINHLGDETPSEISAKKPNKQDMQCQTETLTKSFTAFFSFWHKTFGRTALQDASLAYWNSHGWHNVTASIAATSQLQGLQADPEFRLPSWLCFRHSCHVHLGFLWVLWSPHTSQQHAHRRLDYSKSECACKWCSALDWQSLSMVYSRLVCSVPRIGFGSSATLARIMRLLKMNSLTHF